MFKVEKVSDNRVHIEISGKITSEEMRVGIDELIASSDQITNGSMRGLIHDFDLPSLGAFAVELSRLPSLFGLVRKYDRTAVITDKEWVRKASEIEGMLIPGFEVKAFGLDEEAEAEAWLSK